MMQKPDLSAMTAHALLQWHSAIADELRGRNILRSANNPVGDLGEYLCHKAFGWHLQANSKSGIDALCPDTRTTYQIKARRLSHPKASRQLSALRNLESRPFDYLAAILFNADYTVSRGIILPCVAVQALPSIRYSSHTNSHIVHLTDSAWAHPMARDITSELQAISF